MTLPGHKYFMSSGSMISNVFSKQMKSSLFLSALSVAVIVQVGGFNVMTSNAQAVKNSSFEYVPSLDRVERSQQIENGILRCAEGSQQGLITLLAPSDHVSTTISSRPTFFWYVSDVSAPVRFTVVNPGHAEPVIDISLKADKPGLFKFTLPPNVPELEIGKEYRWTVSLRRNVESPSANPIASASIKRIAHPPQLEQKLSTITSRFDRSAVYANSGIWHDTLTTIHHAPTNETGLPTQSILQDINSGRSMWLINKIPVANYISVLEDSITSRSSSC